MQINENDITLSKNQCYIHENQICKTYLAMNLTLISVLIFFCMFDVRINPDLDLNNYIFLLLALLKEMRMQGQSKISSCYICVLRNSEAL